MTTCHITDWLGWVECHPGMAAWLQAVGAILALAIAILAPAWMARHTDRVAKKRFLESVAAIGAEVQECFANAAMKCGTSEEDGRLFVRSVNAFHRFRIVSAAINAVPVHQLPSYHLTRAVIELQRMMAEGLMQLDAAFKEVEVNQLLVQAALYGQAFSRLARRAHPYLTAIEAVAGIASPDTNARAYVRSHDNEELND